MFAGGEGPISPIEGLNPTENWGCVKTLCDMLFLYVRSMSLSRHSEWEPQITTPLSTDRVVSPLGLHHIGGPISSRWSTATATAQLGRYRVPHRPNFDRVLRTSSDVQQQGLPKPS